MSRRIIQSNRFVQRESYVFLNRFLEDLNAELSAEKILHLQNSNFFDKNLLLSENDHDHQTLDLDFVYQANVKKEFHGMWDVVFGDFPFLFKTKTKWRDLALDSISYSLDLISDKGVGVYLLIGYKWAFIRNDLRKLVEEKNFHITAAINLPSNFLQPISPVRPILTFVSSVKTDYEYLVEFNEIEPQADKMRSVLQAIVSQFSGSASKSNGNYNQDESSGNLQIQSLLRSQGNYNGSLDQGIYVSPRQFKGFEDWKIRKSISKLNTDFASYEVVRLKDLTTEVNFTQGEFEHSENAVYLPLVGRQKCQKELSSLELKHPYLCQLIVDSNIVLPHYLMHYLNSDLGCKTLDLERVENSFLNIPKINRKPIGEIEVALPSLSIQREIVETATKLNKVSTAIDSLQANLSLNPHSSENELKKLERIVSAISELNAADEIRSLARNDESKRLEFKETLSWDIRTKQKNKDLEHAVIKTVAAFLNSDGGDLLVGVADDGKVKGINFEIKKLYQDSKDKFKLHLNNLLRDTIGTQYDLFYERKIVEVGELLVLRISCKPSDQGVYLGKHFYVRTDPATQKLEGKPMVDYVSSRFAK